MVAFRDINLGKPIALVVESDPALRRLTSAIFRQNGYQVHESSMRSGDWEVEEQERTLDVLVVGMTLDGGQNGLRVARRFWEKNPSLRIIVTGVCRPTTDEMQIVSEARVTFLSLPYSFGRLSQAAAIQSTRAA